MKYSLTSMALVIVIVSLFATILATGNASGEGLAFRSLFYGPVVACILTSPFSLSGWSYFEGQNGIFAFAAVFSIVHLFAIFSPLFLPNKWISYVVSLVSLIAWPIIGGYAYFVCRAHSGRVTLHFAARATHPESRDNKPMHAKPDLRVPIEAMILFWLGDLDRFPTD